MQDYTKLAELKSSMKPLVGNGVILRLLSREDLPTTLAWRNRDDIRVHFIHSEVIAWEDHLAWFDRYCSKDDDFVFVIEDTGQLKRPVGQIAMYGIDLAKDEAEYGRLIMGDNEARGRGLAQQATKLLLSWSFGTLGLRRVHLEVFKGNEVALSVYRKNGFVICGERDNLHLMCISKEGWAKVASPNKHPHLA